MRIYKTRTHQALTHTQQAPPYSRHQPQPPTPKPSNPLNTGRLVLWLLVAAPAIREYYEFIEVVKGFTCTDSQAFTYARHTDTPARPGANTDAADFPRPTPPPPPPPPKTTSNPLNTARLVLWLLVAAPAIHIYYAFIEVLFTSWACTLSLSSAYTQQDTHPHCVSDTHAASTWHQSIVHRALLLPPPPPPPVLCLLLCLPQGSSGSQEVAGGYRFYKLGTFAWLACAVRHWGPVWVWRPGQCVVACTCPWFVASHVCCTLMPDTWLVTGLLCMALGRSQYKNPALDTLADCFCTQMQCKHMVLS
jgi:hypothetical protein